MLGPGACDDQSICESRHNKLRHGSPSPAANPLNGLEAEVCSFKSQLYLYREELFACLLCCTIPGGGRGVVHISRKTAARIKQPTVPCGSDTEKLTQQAARHLSVPEQAKAWYGSIVYIVVILDRRRVYPTLPGGA